MESDQPVCVDIDPEYNDNNDTMSRRKRSFDPTKLTWNIDRLDQRMLPLDNQFCPLANGMHIRS